MCGVAWRGVVQLYIYDRLVNELLDASTNAEGNLLHEVLPSGPQELLLSVDRTKTARAHYDAKENETSAVQAVHLKNTSDLVLAPGSIVLDALGGNEPDDAEAEENKPRHLSSSFNSTHQPGSY